MNTDSSRLSAPVSDEIVYYHNDSLGSRILVRIFKKYLSGDVLEVGAGSGGITTQLAKVSKSIVALEPSTTLFRELQQRADSLTNTSLIHGTLKKLSDNELNVSEIKTREFDAILYINVLEHIEDDVSELALAKKFMRVGGRVLIVVPAHKWLYAKVDRLTGHHRRYSKRSLRDAMHRAGLTEVSIRYFDTAGVLPYLILYRMLRSTSTDGANAAIYSRVIMPVSYLLYCLSRGQLLGKNLIAIAGLSE